MKNESFKFSLALLLSIGIFVPSRVFSQSNPSLFSQQVSAELSKVNAKQAAVLIWIDRKTHQSQIFGNFELAKEYFLPGSTLKLITAEAAVKNNLEFKYRCTGTEKIGKKRLHCWTYHGHGSLDLPQALGVSCNLFFAKLGMELGAEKLVRQIQKYSFSKNSELNISTLSTFDVAKLAIGDFPGFRVTPTELAGFWDQYLEKMKKPEYAPIQQGLVRAVHGGTASHAASPGFEILGKTGTGDALSPNYKTNGWFLGAYPTQDPQFAMVVFIQEAYGFREAAKLAEKIFSLAGKYHVLETK